MGRPEMRIGRSFRRGRQSSANGLEAQEGRLLSRNPVGNAARDPGGARFKRQHMAMSSLLPQGGVPVWGRRRARGRERDEVVIGAREAKHGAANFGGVHSG